MRAFPIVAAFAALTLLTVPAHAAERGVIGPHLPARVIPQVEALAEPVGAPTDCPDSGLKAEQGLTPAATHLLRCVHQKWPDLTIGGVRQDSLPDHPSGRALDIMTPGSCSPVGQEIADWAKTNAESLDVQYLIWCSEIWSVQRASEGWRPNTGHRDHVHISVNGAKS